MSDIQVPDEVIEEATRREWSSNDLDGHFPWDEQYPEEKDSWRAGVRAAAVPIAAWARKQAWQDLSRLLGEMLTERPKELEEDTYWHGRWVALRALKADLDDDTIDALLAETKETSA